MNIKLVVLLLLCLPLLSCATASPVTNRDHTCVDPTSIQNWQVLDKQLVVMWVAGSGEVYLLNLFTPLPEMDSTLTLAFVDGDHNGMICGDGGDNVAVLGAPMATFSSEVTAMRPVDNIELQALSDKYHVQLAPKAKPHDKQIHADDGIKPAAQ